MSSPRPLVYVITLAVVLVGTSLYLSSSVAEAGGGVGAAAMTAREDEAGPEAEYAEANSTAGDALEVTVVTRRRARLAPPAGRVFAATVAVGRAARPAEASIVAGPGAADPARAHGRHAVRFSMADPRGARSVLRVLDLEGAPAGSFAFAAGAEVRGRVTGADGAGLAGVAIWAGETVDGARTLVTTDADGGYVWRSDLGGRGVPLVFRAAGFASTFRVVDCGSDFVELDVRLEPARVLRVQLAASVADPSAGRAWLEPSGGDDALVHYPFFDTPRTSLDGDGGCAFYDVPARGAVHVRIAHPGVHEVGHSTVALASPSAATVVVPASVATRRVSGRVVDADERPIEGARVTIDAKGRDVGGLQRAFAFETNASEAVTDADGRYEIASHDRAMSVRVSAPGFLTYSCDVRERGPWPAEVVLPRFDPADADPRLRLDLDRLDPSVRVRHNDEGWRRVASTGPVDVPLDEPAVVDVTVEVARRGAVLFTRTFEARPVGGSVALDLR